MLSLPQQGSASVSNDGAFGIITGKQAPSIASLKSSQMNHSLPTSVLSWASHSATLSDNNYWTPTICQAQLVQRYVLSSSDKGHAFMGTHATQRHMNKYTNAYHKYKDEYRRIFAGSG